MAVRINIRFFVFITVLILFYAAFQYTHTGNKHCSRRRVIANELALFEAIPIVLRNRDVRDSGGKKWGRD